MGLFDFFRRSAPIRDAAALTDFIDRNAAFVAQKGIYEYSRARAGHYAKVLFVDEGFKSAAEVARWRAYPLALAMVAEVADAVLHSRNDDARRRGLEWRSGLTLAAFDRYPVPVPLGEAEWRDLRETLMQRLARIGTHPPKRAKDIPEPYAQLYFDLMPIHEKLRQADRPTTGNYLSVTLCNVHEELRSRLDGAAIPHHDIIASHG